MSLYRHGCKLRLDSLAETCNHQAVILVLPLILSDFGEKFPGFLLGRKTGGKKITVLPARMELNLLEHLAMANGKKIMSSTYVL